MKQPSLSSRVRAVLRGLSRPSPYAEAQLMLLGRMHAERVRASARIEQLADVEFKVFSQWGDDGIIQWLLGRIAFPHDTFIEFGVENYSEANTRFLLLHDNWSGLVMDGSEENIAQIRASDLYWRHDLNARCAFIDAENINALIAEQGFHEDVGLLHIDLDGNDYWIWKAIEVVSPIVVVVEYNAVFGKDRAITVPYDPQFQRTRAHHTNLYFGASLPALHELATAKGYAFIGCNSAGNNAFFVRRDHLNEFVREVPLAAGFSGSKARESRDRTGRLTFLRGEQRLAAISGMPVFDTRTGQITAL